MARKTFVAGPKDSGWRLDAWLAQELPQGVSRSQIQRQIARGNVDVNNVPCKRSSYKIEENDCIVVTLPAEKPFVPRPQRMSLCIVYEDDAIIVVNKPRGILVHPDAHTMDGTLVNGLLAHAPEIEYVGELHRPGIVHRLDKYTSGLLVVAKQHAAYENLINQFSEQKVERVYEAVVHGVVAHDTWEVKAPIGRDPNNRTRMAVHPEGRAAQTRCRVLQRFDQTTLIQASLVTGRTHQIRVHMAYCGHPVVGDSRYGGNTDLFPSGQALHARRLRFVHPTKENTVRFDAPLPDDIQQLLNEFRVGQWKTTRENYT